MYINVQNAMKNMLTNGISQDTRIVWIVWLSFHAQDLQKYHPLGSSTYCENTKISCIPQNFKYITTSDSFIRSQLILVAPCVIRQFCRYCPYSNKPVIWATVQHVKSVKFCRFPAFVWRSDISLSYNAMALFTF